MAIAQIDELRSEFPGHFHDRDPNIQNGDYVQIPINPPEKSIENLSGDEEIDPDPRLDPASEIEDMLAQDNPIAEMSPIGDQEIEQFGDHPGGLTNGPLGGGNWTTVIERLAFYLPFHHYRDWWGIYIYPEGIQVVRASLKSFFTYHAISPKRQVQIAKALLYHHEYYHHAIESFATRLEAILDVPAYLNAFTPLYNKTFGTHGCLEEACANSYAREKIVGTYKSIAGSSEELRRELDKWFRTQPPGYADAAGTGSDDRWKALLRTQFYEDCMNECCSLTGAPARLRKPEALSAAWSTAGGFDRGIGDIDSRICYLIRKNSSIWTRLPTGVRTCIKGRTFKQKLNRLGIGRFCKQGGSHELWLPMRGGRLVPLPRHDGKDMPVGTMRAILRQLGSPLSVEQFLAAS